MPFHLKSSDLAQSGGFLPLLEQFQHYGEHIFIEHPKQPTHLLSHPRYAPLLLRPQHFAKLGKQGRASGLGRLLGQGILTTSDETRWRNHRQIIQPLLNKKALAPLLPAVLEQVDRWLETRANNRCDDLHQAMLELSQKVMYQIIFGKDVPDDALHVSLALATAKRTKVQRARHDYVQRVQAHLAAQPVAGICPHLQQAGLAGEALHDELLTLMAAGQETSAAALTWTLALLWLHPEKMARYYADITRQAPEKLATLPYVRAVFAEALRLYPSIPVAPRVCLVDSQLAETTIKKGERVMLNILGIQRHDGLWQDALTFAPERWLEHSPARFHYLPFGLGRRFCVGREVALLMGETILPYILQRYSIESQETHLPPASVAISLKPKAPWLLTWHRRPPHVAHSSNVLKIA